jgi:hypothetical protein
LILPGGSIEQPASAALPAMTASINESVCFMVESPSVRGSSKLSRCAAPHPSNVSTQRSKATRRPSRDEAWGGAFSTTVVKRDQFVGT